MDPIYPASWARLKHPWTRQELFDVLRQLASDDPCAIWEVKRQMGLTSGFSFFIVDWLFDAVVIDDNGIGFSLFDGDEVRAIEDVKRVIQQIADEMPNATDAAVVAHPLWPEVQRLSRDAIETLEAHA